MCVVRLAERSQLRSRKSKLSNRRSPACQTKRIKERVYSGCGAVRLAHSVRDGEAAGSNPVIPTNHLHLRRWFCFIKRISNLGINLTPAQSLVEDSELTIKKDD